MPPLHEARRLLALDGLRGLCALVVLLHHAVTLFPGTFARIAESAPVAAALAASVSRRNTEAVLLFFVLSGLSIRLSVERRGLHDAVSVLDYLRRRARRILPPYVLALVVSALVAYTVAPVPAAVLSPRTLLGNLLFLQTAIGVPGQWFMPYAGNAALWSLSFEMFFYLGYPLLVLAVAEPRRLPCVMAVSALGFAASAIAPNPFAMFCAAALIWYFGVELAELHLRGRASLPLRAFVVLWLLLGIARLGPRGLELHGLWIGAGFFLAGSLLLRTAARLRALHGGVAASLLAPLARVGLVSYPLYLLHVPILRACSATLGDRAGALACGILGSVALAWLVEQYAGAQRPAVAALQGGTLRRGVRQGASVASSTGK